LPDATGGLRGVFNEGSDGGVFAAAGGFSARPHCTQKLTLASFCLPQFEHSRGEETTCGLGATPGAAAEAAGVFEEATDAARAPFLISRLVLVPMAKPVEKNMLEMPKATSLGVVTCDISWVMAMVSIQTTIYQVDRFPATTPFLRVKWVERLHQIPRKNPTIASNADKNVEDVIFKIAE
jgi:hypothetical protein